MTPSRNGSETRGSPPARGFGCPGYSELTEFSLKRIGTERAREIYVHLLTCLRCINRMEGIDRVHAAYDSEKLRRELPHSAQMPELTPELVEGTVSTPTSRPRRMDSDADGLAWANKVIDETLSGWIEKTAVSARAATSEGIPLTVLLVSSRSGKRPKQVTHEILLPPTITTEGGFFLKLRVPQSDAARATGDCIVILTSSKPRRRRYEYSWCRADCRGRVIRVSDGRLAPPPEGTPHGVWVIVRGHA